MKRYLHVLIAPICIILVIFTLSYIWKLLNLPPEQELILIIKEYFDLYGVWIVFISAIIESGFIVGIYAPGGLVIFLGVIFSTGNPIQAVIMVTSVILGFLIGYSIDFFMGKYGWYKFLLHFGLDNVLQKTKERIEKYGISTAWIGYHDPNLGSLIATTYGTLQYNFKKFLIITIPAVIFWCAFWGIIAYILGSEALKIMGYKALFIVIGVWIIARIIEIKLTEKNKNFS